ncbi:hypothetical protein BH24DEI2_BH24DEI2_10500 [soil metagenome]
MAIYHLHAQIIKRSAGRSAVAAAAYRSGELLYDQLEDRVFDYSRRDHIDHTQILAPDAAPDWVFEREKLWNEVELSERRGDAQLARELHMSLPRELEKDANIELGLGYVREQFVEQGMIADVAFHNLEQDNPHLHVMLTLRSVDEDGFGLKERDWNQRQQLGEWRVAWAEHVNDGLEQALVNERVSCLTLEAQGLEHSAQHYHLSALHMLERGEVSDRVIELHAARRQEQDLEERLETLGQGINRELAQDLGLDHGLGL